MKTKRCSKCNEIKSMNEFYKNKRNKDGLHRWCKKCLKKYCKNNSEKIKKISRNYYKKNNEKLKQQSNEYYQVNKERINKRKIKYRKKYPYGHWVRNTLYKHKIRGFIINITIEELLQIAEKTKYCSMCGIELDWKYGNKDGKVQSDSPTLDRINNQEILNRNNIWIICYKCNILKRNRTIKEFVNYCGIIWNKFNQT